MLSVSIVFTNKYQKKIRLRTRSKFLGLIGSVCVSVKTASKAASKLACALAQPKSTLV